MILTDRKSRDVVNRRGDDDKGESQIMGHYDENEGQEFCLEFVRLLA